MNWPALITRVSFSSSSMLSSAGLRDDVHQGRFAALHHLDGALDGRTQVFRIRDRTFAVHAHAFGQFGVGNIRTGDRGAGAAVGDAAAVAVGHDLHLHYFLMVSAIVVHDVQHRNLV